MAITISGQNNNDKILASDGVLDSISGFNVVGVMTAAQFDVTGKTTINHLDIGSNIQIGNAGIITATSLIGNVTGNVNATSNLLLQIGGSEKFRISSAGQLGIGGNNYGTAGQVLTSQGNSSAVTWSSFDTDKITEGNTEAEVVDTGSDGHFKVTTEGSERLRVKADGDVVVGSAVTISSVGNINATGITTFNGHLFLQKTGAYIDFKQTDGTQTGYIQSRTTDFRFYSYGARPVKFGTNDTERLSIGTDGQIGIAGENYGSSGQVLTSGGSGASVSWSTVTGTTINSNADNRLITGSGTANTLNGEANLTFETSTSGGTLTVAGTSEYQIKLKDTNSSGNAAETALAFTDSGDTIQGFVGFNYWGDGNLDIQNNNSGGSVCINTGGGNERLTVASDGKVSVGGTGSMKIPAGTTAQRPGSSVAGDIRFNSTSSTLEFYNGSVWVGTNAAPTINSVTGTIVNGVSGRTLVINCSDISASGNDVKYSNNSNGSVIATDTSPTTSGSNITSTIPAAVFNTAAGTVIKIEVINSSGVLSQNSVTTTILGAPSGGNITTSGSYRIHSFTSSGTFVVPSGVTLSNVEYLIVAGGGGGGGSAQGHQGGGGGAGGLRTSVVGATSGANSSPESRVTFTAGSYNVTIGAGGVGRASGAGYGGTGVNSGLATPSGTITSNGGGGGGMGQNNGASRGGLSGGCGGGAASSDQSIPAAGSGTAGQGFLGGQPLNQGSGSGGSGGGAGGNGNDQGGSVGSGTGAVGGLGLSNSITGSAATYSVGGDCTDFDGNISAGAANTGDGGDGGYTHTTPSGQAGGSGIVIVRYIL